MGEIKSTLDLVMERTRHMSFSAEEKVKQQRETFEKKLAGLLQQYADQALTVEDLQKRLVILGQEMTVSNPQMVTMAVLSRIDPDLDVNRWLELIRKLNPAASHPLETIITAYQERKRHLMTAGMQRRVGELSRDHAISGSVVRPNPVKDPRCSQQLAALHRKSQKEITALGERID